MDATLVSKKIIKDRIKGATLQDYSIVCSNEMIMKESPQNWAPR